MNDVAATSLPTGRPRNAKASRLWWKVHAWVGLKLCILMSFILATGTLAVVAHEIDWLLHPAMRVSPLPATDQVAWGAIERKVRETHPNWIIRTLEAPIDRWFAAEAIVATPEGEIRRVHAHPETGQVQGDTSWFNTQRFLRDAHRHLLLPLWFGLPLVGLFGVVLLVSGVTSLVVYKKWWRGYLKWPRARAPRTFWGDIHRVAGIWTLPFLFLIGLTGLWYLVEELGLEAPDHKRIGKVTAEAAPPAQDLSSQVAIATRRFPGLEPRYIIYPRSWAETTRVEGDATAILVRHRSNAVELDPRSGDVLLIARGEGLSAHQRISEMADPLHFGTFGGLATKLLWFLFGLLLTALSLTGAYIYALRVSRGAAVK